jgi:cob(I)alamin adenosyltransferase
MSDEKRVVTLSKLYTRSGDDGTTGLVGGQRCAKDDVQVASYGEVDELNATLGLAAQVAQPDLRALIETVQQRLFDLGAHLADGREQPQIALDQSDIESLENWVDQALEGLEPLTSFVLPGGGELAARLHLARTVCRRAERALVQSNRQAPRSPLALHYLNRLSDLLFAWSRVAAHTENQAELLWVPKPKSGESR